MHSCVTSKNVKWCHLIWPTLYTEYDSSIMTDTKSFQQRQTKPQMIARQHHLLATVPFRLWVCFCT